ncbi:sugar phosphate isomerase/epimerase family protein [Scatolibacter rhodanostii]|uniref:sugar phosphate isomerase/epimerase family protein n=1 Tax=Scatolibacter rhodanostii TaxID=2014781 RepID=UPI000C081540|nr:TIM barrel protein [Scatolibacter rhodanostii]
MQESIKRYFNIGIVSFMAFPALGKGECPETVDCLKKIAVDDYFDAIEINWIKDSEIREEAAKMLKASHMQICYGAQPRLLTTGLNPNHIEESERQKAEQTLLEAIDEAESLGAKGIAFLAGKWEEDTKDKAYAQLIKTTENLCRYAQTKNMSIELEVFDYDIAKASLIGPAPYAAKFAADIRSKFSNFGLLVDLSHIPMCYEDGKFTVQTLRPYITHFHIGNTVCQDKAVEGYGDEHQRFGFPGGSNDTKEVLDFLRVLKQEGFFCAENPYVLSFEVKPWKEEDSEIIIANAKRVLNRAWAMLEE